VKTEPLKAIRVAVVSWCCNDHSTFNKMKGGRYKCTEITDAMRVSARALRDRLDRYDAGIILGPGSADVWNIDNSWETGAKELLENLLPEHFQVWRSERTWRSVEKVADGWHMISHAKNTEMVAKHIARAVDYVVSCRYLHGLLQHDNKLAGDGELRPYLDQAEKQVTQEDFVQAMKTLWSGAEYKADNLSPQASKAVFDELVPKDTLRATGSREIIAEGIAEAGEEIAYAYDRSGPVLVEDEMLTATDPVDKDSQRIEKLFKQAMDDETKATNRSTSSAAAEPIEPMDVDAFPGESREETAWYQSLRDKQIVGFHPRGSNPKEAGATWMPVKEWWD